MAKPAFPCRTISLKKTKLGESDLIITALKDDGSLLKGVAKGARKPSNQFATRLEVFSVCDCLVAPGRSLHVFSEARCVRPHLRLRTDLDSAIAAAPIVDALAATAQEGLEIPRLFSMSCAALDAIEDCEADAAPAVTAAFLLKLLAMLGLRPCFTDCICCGAPLDVNAASTRIAFSFQDGGAVCDGCATGFETIRFDTALISWCQALLMSRFCEVVEMNPSPEASFAVLEFLRGWFRENLGMNLKSLNFLLTEGL